MNTKYLDTYVALGILTAIIVLLWLLAIVFLSSQAEASHGDVQNPLTTYDTCRVSGSSDNRFTIAALVYEAPREVFQGGNPSVRYVLEWPHLPSVAEQQVQIAKAKLTEFTAIKAEIIVEKKRQVELKLDTEALWKAMGLGFICIGGVLTIVFGRPLKVYKSPTDKGETIG